jgi:hypothetical protein
MFHISVAKILRRNRIVAHGNNSCTRFHIMCTGWQMLGGCPISADLTDRCKELVIPAKAGIHCFP